MIKKYLLITLNILGYFVGISYLSLIFTEDYSMIGILGVMLFSLPFFAFVRGLFVKKVSKRWIRVVSYIVICVIGFGMVLSDDPISTENNVVNNKNKDTNDVIEDKQKDEEVQNKEDNNIPERPKNDEETLIDEVVVNSEQYIGKTITIKGFLPWENKKGRNWMYTENWAGYIEIKNVSENLKNGYEITVTGKLTMEEDRLVINAKSYKVNEDVIRREGLYEGDDEPVKQQSMFSLMREASINNTRINWNQFFLNPTSYADTLVWVSGKVIYLEVGSGMTNGIIDTTGNGNVYEWIYFTILDEVYDFNVGDFISPLGRVFYMTQTVYNQNTGESANAPSITVEKPNLWRNSYSIDFDNEEIASFMFGTYERISGGDIDHELGNTVDFNKSSINGYPYEFKEIYRDGRYDIDATLKIGGTGYMPFGFVSGRIGMTLIIDGIYGNYPNSDNQFIYTTVSIPLDGSTVSIRDGDYYKVSGY